MQITCDGTDLTRSCICVICVLYFSKTVITTLDYIIIGIVALGAILGFMKGGIRQVAGVVGLVAGLLIARAMFGALGEKIASEFGTSLTVSQIISFIVIWLVVPIVLSLLASALTKVIEVVHLGLVNRLLGALCGLVKYALLISLAITFLDYIDSKDELVNKNIKDTSLLYHPLGELSGVFLPAVKQAANELLEKV